MLMPKRKQHLALTLVVAPAGFGKTTLMMQWRQTLLSTTSPGIVAWLSLDEADSDPNRFLSYLILTLERAAVVVVEK